MKIVRALPLLLCAALGCSKADIKAVTKDSPYPGTWITADGNMKIKIASDGTWQTGDDKSLTKGTWTVTGTTLTFKYEQVKGKSIAQLKEEQTKEDGGKLKPEDEQTFALMEKGVQAACANGKTMAFESMGKGSHGMILTKHSQEFKPGN